MSDDLVIVRPDVAHLYDLGPSHPQSAVRVARDLAIDLARELGLLDRDGISETVAPPADDGTISTVHDGEYVNAVRRYSAEPELAAAPESGDWGLHPAGDTPAFAGMHEAAAAVAGAARHAALLVHRGEARRAFSHTSGLHHALARRASGFCVYNDCAIAIRALLDEGAERVAYVDVDVHHGDGVQWLFYEDPRVLTCSVHESGRMLFPGTGHLAERGSGPGVGFAVNVPLPAWSGGEPYLRAIDDVIAPAVRAFRPEVIITQTGVDSHHADPLAHIQLAATDFEHLWRRLGALCDDTTDGRWVCLGGGGYNPDTVVRAFALLVAELVGREAPDVIPAAWRERAEAAIGRPIATTLRGDVASRVPPERAVAADSEADEVIASARLLLGIGR